MSTIYGEGYVATTATGPAPLPAQSPKQQDAEGLLKRGVQQLRAWHTKYAWHQPAWLPPAGDVRWLEDADAFLAMKDSPPSGE